MKETVITPDMKKRELVILLICFIVAFVLNVIGIVVYETPAVEMITQLHLVLIVSLVLYVIAAILRGIFYLVSRLWKR